MPTLPNRRPTPGSNPPGAPPRTPGGGADRPITPEGRRNRLVRRSKRIVWYGSEKPSKKLAKKYKIGKAGSGPLKGYYVALKKKPKKPPKPTGPTVGNGTQVGIGPGNTGSLTPPATPAAPAAPTGPYSELPEWARNYMLGFDTQAQQHQNYVTGQVMPWLSEALKGVGQFSEAAQGQIQNTGNAGAGALQVASQAGTPNVAPVAPGAGPIQGDQAYQLNAANQAAGAISGAMQDRNRYQADMSRFGLANQSSAVISSMGQFAAGLPAAYSQRRNERLLEIRNYVERERQFNETQARLKSQFDADMQLATARFEEDKRRYGEEFAYRQFNDARNAAIAQLNANNGLILGLGNLGLKGTELANDLANQPDFSAPAPYGYNRDPVTGKPLRDPSIPQAGSGDGSGGGGPEVDTRPFKQGTSGWFTQNGWKKVRNRKHLDALKKLGIVPQKSVDGSGVWFLPGSGKGGGDKPKPKKDAGSAFQQWYAQFQNSGSTQQPSVQIGLWIYNMKDRSYGGKPFTHKNGVVNGDAIQTMLIDYVGRSAAQAVWNYLKKTKIKGNKWR